MLASPLERFSRAIVRDQDLPLRIRIFRLVCAVVAVLCLVVVAPANLFQNLPLGVNLANILLGLFGGFFYWESCRGRHHVVAFLLIAVVMLDVTWFWNAGSQGSITYYYFPLLLFVLGLFRGRAQWILTVGLVLNVAALFVVESRFPGLVTPFQSPTDRILDHLTGIVCSVVAAAAMASVILAGYDREHQTLRASEERFRALAALSPDIISIFDREGRLTFNSAAARKIHGGAAGALHFRTDPPGGPAERPGRLCRGPQGSRDPGEGAVPLPQCRRLLHLDGGRREQ